MSKLAGHTKLDNRIRYLIQNGVATGHRSMFAIVGEKGKYEVAVLYEMMCKSIVASRPNVLWCYKHELEFSSNRKKRMKQYLMRAKAGNVCISENVMDQFINSTNIRFCYYKETKNILGNTYGMLVLQDFEALTPNLLARTIETVEGGGIVIFLMNTVTSLRQLYTITMDVHNRYRTSSSYDVVPRFNERFILSLASCQQCLVLDDTLNPLPVSSHMSKITPIPAGEKQVNPNDEELVTLKDQLRDTKPIGPLLGKCKTLDQGKVLLRLLDVLTDKNLNVTCSITAARGRGKSAALGLALAAAAAFGYTNIFLTSPSPENLNTLFQFVVKGLQTLEWQEHIDFDLVQSTNPEFNKAIVRVNINREHRQVIQYIHPTDAVKLGQAELLVIDEAAAIPLPQVKELIAGNYLVFLASTINGYEGTGRSLSLKLLQQLRNQSVGVISTDKVASKGRVLHELTMEESIRYKPGDQVEAWLNKVLCLDAPSGASRLTCGTPPPNDCQLYYVNRDTLFSFHKASEAFLHQVMSIYVSAHYKNTPNDLQMLSDAPAHHLFVLMAPIKDDQLSLPQVLAVVQVCLEGNMNRALIHQAKSTRRLPAGDLLPWTISQQFQDNAFPTLCGGRIVRIAVHPDYQGMGYGARSLELLEDYYRGLVPCLNEKAPSQDDIKTVKSSAIGLLDEQLVPRQGLPPLMQRLDERRPEKIDYIGTSFGLTLPLFKFWKRARFVPVYLRQSVNEITGEHTCIMLKELRENQADLANSPSWLSDYHSEFRGRLTELLSFDFRGFSSQLALSLLTLPEGALPPKERKVLSRSELSIWLADSSLARLSYYARNMVDHSLITDLLPTVAKLYFLNRFPKEVTLSAVQQVILIGLGLQRKGVQQLARETELPSHQMLAVHNKCLRKLVNSCDDICEGAIVKAMEEDGAGEMDELDKMDEISSRLKPLAETLEEDLDREAGRIREKQEKEKQNLRAEMAPTLAKYKIKSSDSQWEQAIKGMKKRKITDIGSISVASKRVQEKVKIRQPEQHVVKRKKQTGLQKARDYGASLE